MSNIVFFKEGKKQKSKNTVKNVNIVNIVNVSADILLVKNRLQKQIVLFL